jgi:hypothetical protein
LVKPYVGFKKLTATQFFVAAALTPNRRLRLRALTSWSGSLPLGIAGATTQRIFLLRRESLRLFDARNSWLKWSAVALVLLVLSLNRLLQTQRWKKHEFYRQVILNKGLRAGFTVKKKERRNRRI